MTGNRLTISFDHHSQAYDNWAEAATERAARCPPPGRKRIAVTGTDHEWIEYYPPFANTAGVPKMPARFTALSAE